MAKTKEIVPVDIERLPVIIGQASKFKTKPTEQVIENTIDEIEAIIVQRGKVAREEAIGVFWETGQVLRRIEKTEKVSISALVSRIALDNRISGKRMGERNLWFAIKFYDVYPKFELVYETEHGENVSISKIKKSLITPKPKKSKGLQEVAYDLVDRLGADEALKLCGEIEKEVKRREEHGR